MLDVDTYYFIGECILCQSGMEPPSNRQLFCVFLGAYISSFFTEKALKTLSSDNGVKSCR